MLGRGSVEEEVEIRVQSFSGIRANLSDVYHSYYAWLGLAVFTMYKAYVGSITASGGF